MHDALPNTPSTLFVSYSHPAYHTDGERGSSPIVQAELNEGMEKIDDAILSISLATPVDRGIFGVGATSFPDAAVPCWVTWKSWALMPITAPLRSYVVNENQLIQADQILKNFNTCSPEIQAAFRVPMRHINFFGSRISDVERAVHLRIALESTLVRNNRHNIASKISTRASRVLGSNTIEIEKIRNIFRQSYKICSDAVHDGKLKNSRDIIKITEAANYLNIIIQKFIANRGFPNWSNLQFRAQP
jgi:hypothetical protein